MGSDTQNTNYMQRDPGNQQYSQMGNGFAPYQPQGYSALGMQSAQQPQESANYLGRNDSRTGQSASGWGFPQNSYVEGSSNDSISASKISSINPALSSISLNNTQNDVFSVLDYLEKSYDRNSQFYKFVYIFYNIAGNPGVRQERPFNISPELWEQAEKQNPSPGELSPEIIFGYEELNERVENQKQMVKRLETTKKYLSEKMNELIEDGAVRLSNRITSIVDKYRTLLIEILEQMGKMLGAESSSSLMQYEQLEKRLSLANTALNSLAENPAAYRKVFNAEKTEEVVSIVRQQHSILLEMVQYLRKKREEVREGK